MSISDKMNGWFEQFINFNHISSKTEKELWTLHSLDSLKKLFDNAYSELPNPPATSKIQTFLNVMVKEINQLEKEKQYRVLNAFYILKSYYTTLLTTVLPAEYYLNYLPHNFKVFYVDVISILMKFPHFKSQLVTVEDIPSVTPAKTAEKNTTFSTKDKLVQLLSTIPYNTEFDKKLALAKELILDFIKEKADAINALAEIIDELATPKYDYLRKDKNLLRTLTGTFTRNHTWSIILNDIKQKTLDILKSQIAANQVISDETWNLSESILNERAMAAVLFKDHYLEELAMLRRKYISKSANTERVV